MVLGLASAVTAQAQPASALGNPLPTPSLATGTVSVRVVAGSPANLVIGTDVTLTVNGTPRVARTDSTGHAIFKDLPPGATVQAKVIDEDKKEVPSTAFPLPEEGGVTVMLSTKPWSPGGGGGGAPFAGGGQGMPEPRQLSGEVRPEQADPAGTFTVRLTYDDFKDAPPVGVPVTLVGYASDDSISAQTVASDKDGRAKFTGLDRSGATSYFALAELPRNGGVDRLMSQPATLDGQAGVRVALSADKRTSNAPAIDDLEKIERGQSTPDGKVRVVVEGETDMPMEISLVDAKTRAVLGKGTPAPGQPDPSNVAGRSHFTPKPDVPAGSLDVQAHGGQGPANDPLEGIGVRVIPADAKAPPADLVATKTPATGMVRIALQTTGKVKAVLTINGRDFVSDPFELAKTGGVLDVEAHWEEQGKSQVLLDLAPAGQTVYAETTVAGRVFRSVPFQPAAGHGTQISVFVLPTRILFQFSWRTEINDEYLLVGGRFSVYNNAWAPYNPGPDGLLVPLPRGFKSAQLDNRDKVDVAIASDGFRLTRPIPPGQREFHGQFALPVQSGIVKWWLDLPFGALQSGMQIQQIPGMQVDLESKDVQGQTRTVPEGTFFVIPQINIRPGQSMVMSISGLPASPAWQTWVPRVVGIAVIAMIAGGLGFAMRRKRPGTGSSARAERRAKLLDELVELDKAGDKDGRREAVVQELEQLWD